MKVLGSEKRELAFRGYFYTNQSTTMGFWYLYFGSAIAGLFGILTIMAATTINLILVIHASAKFAIVRRRLESLKRDDVNVNEQVADCVKRHQAAILY